MKAANVAIRVSYSVSVSGTEGGSAVRHFTQGVFATLAVAAAAVVLLWFVLLPRLNWGANQSPGIVERTLANDSLSRWVTIHANAATNPFSPTADNLTAARTEYNEHCAACHGLDGSGSNQFEAHFYPPIANLTDATRHRSDAEIYFIVANGIGYSAMPGFANSHSPEDIWRLVLWVRHLSRLTPEEKAAIESETRASTAEHEHSMEH